MKASMDFEPNNEFGFTEFSVEFPTLSTMSWSKKYALEVIMGKRKGRNTLLGKFDPTLISETL